MIKEKKPIIICVDDEKIILNSLNRQLQRRFGKQYDLEFCENANEAIELVGELGTEGYKVVMIISDQVMPGMTGDQFLAHIHENYPKPIKILLTGQGSLNSAINAINKANLYRYITKPWDEEDFLLTIEKGLQQYNLLERTQLQAEAFARFVPQQFLESLGKKSILDIHLGDHLEREMSILFCDMRNFTTISESMTLKEIYDFINSYLQYLEPTIQKNHGFIDKYIGDAVMALFYTPEDALNAARDIQATIMNLNKIHQGEKYYPIASGIGLHVGNLMLGIVGVESRMQGTVLSNAVNIASRLQSLTAEYDIRILATDEFIKKLPNQDPISKLSRFLGKIRLRGKKEYISVVEVISKKTDSYAKLKIVTKKDFEEGLTLFNEKKFAEACVKFKLVLEVNPHDKIASIYLNKAAEFMLNGVPEGWDGSVLPENSIFIKDED